MKKGCFWVAHLGHEVVGHLMWCGYVLLLLFFLSQIQLFC